MLVHNPSMHSVHHYHISMFTGEHLFEKNVFPITNTVYWHTSDRLFIGTHLTGTPHFHLLHTHHVHQVHTPSLAVFPTCVPIPSQLICLALPKFPKHSFSNSPKTFSLLSTSFSYPSLLIFFCFIYCLAFTSFAAPLQLIFWDNSYSLYCTHPFTLLMLPLWICHTFPSAF